MSLVEVKTAELIGPTLDWAVAKADGHEPIVTPFKNSRGNALYRSEWEQREGIRWQPSTDWGQGGPIIDRLMQRRFGISSERHEQIVAQSPGFEGWGTTALIAAMRCLVASKLGDTVQVPKELMP